MSDSRRRALIAALVGVFGASLMIAGAGHAYLRKWRRALAWFTFVVGSFLILSSIFSEPARTMLSEHPFEVQGPVLTLLFLSVFDAYRLAVQERGPRVEEGAGNTCPNCGKEVDRDLDFCHWCTEPLDESRGEGRTGTQETE